MSAYSFNTSGNIYMSRRKFDMSHKVTTTMKVGKLTPINCEEVLPGDGWYTKLRYLARLSTAFVRPVMDSFFMDTFHFFVPLRELYTEYESVFGNPSPSAYVDNDLGEFPTYSGSITVPEKTVGDYLTLPTKVELPKNLSVLKYRAFALIYEHWFRNQNTVEPMHVQRGEIVDSELPNNNDWAPNNYTGKLPDISKFNDYFTSCLPNTQKGGSVILSNAGSIVAQDIPVVTKDKIADSSDTNITNVLRWRASGNHGGGNTYRVSYLSGGSGLNTFNSVVGSDSEPSIPSGTILYNKPVNLWAELPDLGFGAINVNDLRFAVKLQEMLEKDARGGSRYNEYVLSHYGVSMPDLNMQIPEYLGGLRTPLSLQQVAQTSQNEKNNALGSLGAYSQSYGRSRYSKSFFEHGFIMTLAAIRYKHSYQQGIDRSFMRSRREDFYDPLFAHLGEQPVYKWQLFGNIDTDKSLRDGAVFGYQEYAADYRYRPDVVTGEMRSNATYSFDVYHFADDYENAPSLTSAFTNEDAEFFRRTTVVAPVLDPDADPDSTKNLDVDDFLVEFYFDSKVIRSMPIRSVPSFASFK